MLFYRNASQFQCELYLHLREEGFYATGISNFNFFKVASRIEAAHFEDLYNTLISIINGNKDETVATLGLIVHQKRKSAFWTTTHRSIYF